MLGYDMSWAAFNIIEVMSSTRFTFKVGVEIISTYKTKLNIFLHLQRIGYLSASQCFHENCEVVMLTTNMIRKVKHLSPIL